MNYIDITKANQLLYEALESFTNQINACKVSSSVELMDNIIAELSAKKEMVRDRINLNLELLDKLWTISSLKARDLTIVSDEKIPSELEEMIIESYINNPGRRQYQIAIEFNVGQDLISRVLTNYLNHKYKPRSA